ncbi:hypothetical protein GM710_18230, partial [Vibrio cholerae]|nr:hypothetical protein [Vibrio cholerae]MUJ88141.1 hypothetical protein [Vibrio cholerae]MUK00349.1 hypothetical protein [Vibrio cholerae]MUK07023.1 hypothetical protein [Vibrio cholerae]MUK21158.1 hypothetical protein [Vibrio cholerae]
MGWHMLKATIKKLLKPLYYLKIKHEQKLFIDIYLPLMVAALFLFLLSRTSVEIAFVGKSGLVQLVNGLLQVLIGFFVASLAAVATFQRPGMDENMRGKAPTLQGKGVTRRQYLCYMFGYLAFMSIAVYFGSGVLELTMKVWKETFGSYFTQVKLVAVFIYFSLVSNIIFTTLLALHFLTDRIVRDNDVEPDD